MSVYAGDELYDDDFDRSTWPRCVVCGGPFAPSEAAAGWSWCEYCPKPDDD